MAKRGQKKTGEQVVVDPKTAAWMLALGVGWQVSPARGCLERPVDAGETRQRLNFRGGKVVLEEKRPRTDEERQGLVQAGIWEEKQSCQYDAVRVDGGKIVLA